MHHTLAHAARKRRAVLQVGFEELEQLVLGAPDPGAAMGSARQELAEIYLDMAIK